jgi:chromate reductase
LREVPPYDADDDVEPAPAAGRRLRDAIASADAVRFATPEYNSSFPGVLKNAVDWASRPRGSAPLLGKPVAVVGATTGSFGAVWAQAELRKVLGSAGARVIDRELPVSKADSAFDEDGRLLDHELRGRLEETLAELVAEAELDAEVASPIAA